MKQFYPAGKAESFSNEVFKIFDRDHSGKLQLKFFQYWLKNCNSFALISQGNIDFVEFLVAVNTTTSTDIHLKLKLAFDLYDVNDNG